MTTERPDQEATMSLALGRLAGLQPAAPLIAAASRDAAARARPLSRLDA